jgi:hypothetical protein
LVLEVAKDDQQDRGQDEEQNYAQAVPVILGATPLQRKKHRNDGGNQDEHAQQVEMLVEVDSFGNPW